ncbi:MAG: hypothetical protein [Microviridae sp.]|nr:MAG: hypothetical protein [Microviridae sp.]
MKISEVSCLGRRAFGFNMYRDMKDEQFVPECNEEVPVVVDPNKALFGIVFSVDPRTNLPCGDLAMFMNDNVDPSVRRFIETQLHNPLQSQGDAHGDLSGLSDDDVLEFMRQPDESVSAYRDRMFEVIKSHSHSELNTE